MSGRSIQVFVTRVEHLGLAVEDLPDVVQPGHGEDVAVVTSGAGSGYQRASFIVGSGLQVSVRGSNVYALSVPW